MIYTCYDMIRDCREGRPEGWSHFISHYVPVIRRILARYAPAAADGLLQPLVAALREPPGSLFESLEPVPERPFVAELRDRVLASLDVLAPAPSPEIPLDLETLSAALEPLTPLEKQAVWLETMSYPPADTGPLLRMEPLTVEKIRARAAELLRAHSDSWRRSLLAENGRELGRAAASVRTKDCVPAKAFLDVIDGRATWSGREDLDRHLAHCWHCVDHFCRLIETVDFLHGIQPLPEIEAAELRHSLGIELEKRPAGWKRLFGRA